MSFLWKHVPAALPHHTGSLLSASAAPRVYVHRHEHLMVQKCQNHLNLSLNFKSVCGKKKCKWHQMNVHVNWILSYIHLHLNSLSPSLNWSVLRTRIHNDWEDRSFERQERSRPQYVQVKTHVDVQRQAPVLHAALSFVPREIKTRCPPASNELCAGFEGLQESWPLLSLWILKLLCYLKRRALLQLNETLHPFKAVTILV